MSWSKDRRSYIFSDTNISGPYNGGYAEGILFDVIVSHNIGDYIHPVCYAV